MSFVEVKQKKKKKEKKIFSKQFVTTELTKYGLKFGVLSIIIDERKLIKKCLSLKFKRKKLSYWKKKIKYLVNNSLLLNQRNMA